ncbi:uncharacterized protein heatr4 [Centropristis striata]|uniref:uncharacterized protein heatr4 n=1 Tax=Centropristis striata TaxID=184440 RepID=UPI0027E06A4C|nr:uncharacterized protein heatr4 [Centropristis striata]
MTTAPVREPEQPTQTESEMDSGLGSRVSEAPGSVQLQRSQHLFQLFLTDAAAGLHFSQDALGDLCTSSLPYNKADFQQLFRPSGALKPSPKRKPPERKVYRPAPRPAEGFRTSVPWLELQMVDSCRRTSLKRASGLSKPVHKVAQRDQDQILLDKCSKYHKNLQGWSSTAPQRRTDLDRRVTPTHTSTESLKTGLTDPADQVQTAASRPPQTDSAAPDVDSWLAAHCSTLEGEQSQRLIQRLVAQLFVGQEDEPDAQDQPLKSSDQPPKSSDQPLKKLGPAPKELRPTPKVLGPAPKELGPAPKELGPTPKELRPTPKELAPTPKELAPAPKELRPTPKELGPAPKELGPAPKELGPAPKELGPTPKVLGPTPKELGPTPGHPAAGFSAAPLQQPDATGSHCRWPEEPHVAPEPQTLVRSLLAEQLNSSSWRCRLTSCQTLCRLRGPLNKDVMDKLTHLMYDDRKEAVRRAAAETLLKLGNKHRLHTDLRLKLEGGRGLRGKMEALDVIGHLKLMTASLREPLISCFSDEVAAVRRQACETAASLLLIDETVESCLLQLVENDAAAEVRLSAIRAVGALGLSSLEVQETLLRCVETEEEAELRLAACRLLQSCGTPSDQLRHCLLQQVHTESNWKVRRAMQELLHLCEPQEEHSDTQYKLQVLCESSVITEKLLLLEKLQVGGQRLRPAALARRLSRQYMINNPQTADQH